MTTTAKIDSGIEDFKNDLGKPWRYEEDGYTVTRACAWSAPGCHPVGCGVKLYVNKDGILEKVEGDENQPITQGRLCMRCLTLTDFTYHPDRVIYPMKRAKEDRGKNKWERITWDEAYDIIEENIQGLKEKYGPESIVVFGGTGREGGPMCGPYGAAMIGTPNACYTQSGYACYQPRMMSSQMVLGALYPELDYAGGLEGGMTNGEPLVMTCAMKPIPTMMQPLDTVDTDTLMPVKASKERSDVCAVPAAAVVAEGEVAFALANAYLEAFGDTCMADIKANIKAYKARLRTMGR